MVPCSRPYTCPPNHKQYCCTLQLMRHSHCPVIGQEPLSIIQLWRRFRALRPDFISSFAAYQHCRSRGWVPKGGSGAKYGADFSKTHTPKHT